MANYTTTLTAVNISPLNLETRILGFNTKFTIPFAFVAQASATTATDVVTVTLGNTPAIWCVEDARVVITTAFAGTTALTIQVGTTSSIASMVTAQSVLTAGVLGAASTLGSLTNATATSALSLVATFTNATGGSPSAVTSGSCDIYLNVQDCSAGALG